jgi:hypothetical protein
MESWNVDVNFTVKAMGARGDNGTVSNGILGTNEENSSRQTKLNRASRTRISNVNVFTRQQLHYDLSFTTSLSIPNALTNSRMKSTKAQGKLSDPVQMKDANEMPCLQVVMKVCDFILLLVLS